MIVAIHQPDYIPWLGFYYKMAHCDTFVYLDDAQYSNEAAHNVNAIKTPQGKFKLKIPVEQHLGDLICNVKTKDSLNWQEKHLKTIQMNYSKARYFKETFPGFADVVNAGYSSIADLNMAINEYICNGFGIHPKIMKSSDMAINSVREERVIDITVSVGGDEYLSGNGARAYQVDEHFTERNVKLTYLDYKPIVYKQLWKDFLPCMSAIDYIFNCGFDWQYVEEQVKALNS